MNKRIDVPYLDQTHDAPTGCESVTAVMLLRYLGVQMDVRTFIDVHLPKQPLTMRDGVLWGPDPNCCFAGDPYRDDAMGCYAPVLTDVLKKLIGRDYAVVNETGAGLDVLAQRYLTQDMPVIVWTTINMRPYVEGPQWRLYDSGQWFTWRSNEHCLLLVGCDETHFIFNDPWENRGVVACDKSLARMRHAEQYQMAVGIRRRENN